MSKANNTVNLRDRTVECSLDEVKKEVYTTTLIFKGKRGGVVSEVVISNEELREKGFVISLWK